MSATAQDGSTLLERMAARSRITQPASVTLPAELQKHTNLFRHGRWRGTMPQRHVFDHQIQQEQSGHQNRADQKDPL